MSMNLSGATAHLVEQIKLRNLEVNENDMPQLESEVTKTIQEAGEPLDLEHLAQLLQEDERRTRDTVLSLLESGRLRLDWSGKLRVTDRSPLSV